MDKWYVSCPQFTIKLVTDENGIITDGFVDAGAQWKRFLGQPMVDFVRHLKEINKPEPGERWPPISVRPLHETSDAVQILHKRYVGDDPDRIASLEEERRNAKR
jgi:hypothetical protein